MIDLEMTCEEFNKKWAQYLEPGFYGLVISDAGVIEYLDEEFSAEVLENPAFTYAQIKLKFGRARVYAESEKTSVWEDKINTLIK